MTRLPEEFLRLLACPETKAPLVQWEDWLYSTDARSRRRYPIREGIPTLLIDQSEIVEASDYERVMEQVRARESTEGSLKEKEETT